MGTHPIFESDFDCLTEQVGKLRKWPLTVKKERKTLLKVNRNTKSESPSLPRIAPLSSESQTSWSRLPRTSPSKSRVQSVCQQMVKVPRPGIVSRCEFTNVSSIFNHQLRLSARSLNFRLTLEWMSKSPFATRPHICRTSSKDLL